MNCYLIFHHNLAFSSIPGEHYRYLIDTVYSRLLDIAEEGIPLGLEYTGETLEIISRLQPDFVERLKGLWETGRCDVIGSSYSQAIFPLIPACVNRWNLALGQKVYYKLLGRVPEIAYLNEQVYAESICPLYKEAGFRALVFDWMNAVKDNPWPTGLRYVPVRHNPTELWFLWSDCIAFQKFQRVISGEIESEEWIAFLTTRHKEASAAWGADASFCLYSSDAEVFDYRPGGLATHMANRGHLQRVKDSLTALLNSSDHRIIRPTEVLGIFSQDEIPGVNSISTPSYPLRTKKQNKYNVTRWAVTGRESTRMNTQCHQLLKLVKTLAEQPDRHGKALPDLQKDLVSLWGSDFRTHTTDGKFEAFRHRMGAALSMARKLSGKSAPSLIEHISSPPEVLMTGQWQPLSSIPSQDLVRIKGRRAYLSTPGVSLTLLKNKGLAIEELVFPKIAQRPLLGTLAHGIFADISLGADFFSGNLVLVTQDGRQITDLSCQVDDFEVAFGEKGVGLRNKAPMELPGLSLVKTYILHEDSLRLSYDFYAMDLRPATMRLGIWTLLPGSFKRKSLFFSTHFGGDKAERFYLAGSKVVQDQPVNHVVTAQHCLGNTEGEAYLGDADKQIMISTCPSELYSVPLLHYEETGQDAADSSFFCSLYYTICERDDVAHVFWKGHSRITFIVKGLKANC